MPRAIPLHAPLLFALVAMSSGGWVLYRRATAPAPYARHPLGEPLPDVPVITPDGKSMRLRERLGAGPSLVYVFNAAQCASCSNLALEFRIIRDAYPTVTPLLVGSGASASEFARAFATMGVADAAVVDEDRALLRALSFEKEPLVLLVDASGRILFVDQRSASQAAQYPMGHVLHDLQSLLGPVRKTP